MKSWLVSTLALGALVLPLAGCDDDVEDFFDDLDLRIFVDDGIDLSFGDHDFHWWDGGSWGFYWWN